MYVGILSKLFCKVHWGSFLEEVVKDEQKVFSLTLVNFQHLRVATLALVTNKFIVSLHLAGRHRVRFKVVELPLRTISPGMS